MYRYVYYFCVYTKPHPQALALRIYERLDAMGKKPVNKKPAAKMSGKPEAASSSTLKAASSQSPEKATAAKALSPQQDTPETINSSPDKAFVKRELRLQASQGRNAARMLALALEAVQSFLRKCPDKRETFASLIGEAEHQLLLAERACKHSLFTVLLPKDEGCEQFDLLVARKAAEELYQLLLEVRRLVGHR